MLITNIYLLLLCLSLSLIVNANNTKINKLEQQANVWYKKYIKISPGQNISVLGQRILKQKKTSETGFVLFPYKPNYILPYYYTGTIANNQNTPTGLAEIKKSEFKFQFSILAPLFTNIYKNKISILAGYTQLSYWQFYNKPQWFRETNYEPEIMATYVYNLDLATSIGLVHQSNGRGGTVERSWNRLYWTSLYSKNNWLVSAKFWILVFKPQSVNLHNPDIAKYLGHEELLYNYKSKNHSVLSIKLRNIERPKYIAVNINFSYPLTKNINLYLELFHGYGQSLIEYQTKTTSAGIGINLSNWI